MSRERHEIQRLEYGVIRADGKVQVCAGLSPARQRCAQLNNAAEAIGLGRPARVVSRRATIVTTTEATPWATT